LILFGIVNSMRKAFLILALLFCFLTLPAIVDNAVFARQMMPGLDCGLAGGENGIDACCYNQTEGLPDLPGQDILSHFPFVGGPIKKYEETDRSFQKLQEDYNNNLPCLYGEANSDPAQGKCTCVLPQSVSGQSLTTNSAQTDRLSAMCGVYKFENSSEASACVDCATTQNGYWSGLGCIPLDPSTFISAWILKIGIGFGGLFALLCIIYSAIRIQVSRGEAESIQKARENITSCVIGLILIIFSVFILRLIGVQVLGLPGLG